MRGSVLVAIAMMVGCKEPTPPAAPAATPPAPLIDARPAASPTPPTPIDATMRGATLDDVAKLYDRADFAGAAAAAEEILRHDPNNIRMLRVATSSYCALGDGDRARRHWRRLPPKDRQDMTRRCDRYGITL